VTSESEGSGEDISSGDEVADSSEGVNEDEEEEEEDVEQDILQTHQSQVMP